jgi:secondary thiamine-phosphate synthase enzyme
VEFTVRTTQREEFVDITAEVERALGEAGPTVGSDGIALVFVPHTTAGVTINENADPDVAVDVLAGFRRLVPHDGAYRHVEGNSDAHIKTSLVGSSVTLPVERGQLALGRWQGVYLCEFDGPRTRRVSVMFVGGRSE